MASVLRGSQGRLLSSSASVEADDEHGVLVVKGLPSDVEQVRQMVGLIDLPRQRAELWINVDAPADKVHYRFDLQLFGGQVWTSEDKDLGLKIDVTAGDQVGNSLTLVVATNYQGHEMHSKFRLALGKATVQTFGISRMSDKAAGFPAIEQTPVVTFKYMGRHGE
jgi:type II secretory pathway component GspD/PulD (secretin)